MTSQLDMPVQPGPAEASSADIHAAADGVLTLLRTVRKARARMVAAETRGDVGSATQLLLHTVAELGPMRTSTLAASLQSDLSTVSRQVGALVSEGLIERRADPQDGRACLLALTSAGTATVAEHEQGREAFFAEVLDGWTAAELRQFSGLLTRFSTSYDQVHDARTAQKAARRAPLQTVKGNEL